MRILVSTIVLSLALAGCKSTGVDVSETAAQSLREMVVGLKHAPTKIDAVAASLRELSTDGGDMKVKFATFSGHVDALIGHREHLRSLKAGVESSRTKFVEGWKERAATIKDEDLRKRAEERRAAVVAEFGKIAAVSDSGKAEFEPWLMKVESVRTYLESDLNPGGVASVKGDVETISKGAASVNEKISTVVSELERVGNAIAATKPPEPAAAKSPEPEKK